MPMRSLLITMTTRICLFITTPFATAQDEGSEPPISPEIIETYSNGGILPGYWQDQTDDQLRQWLSVAEFELDRCKKNGTALEKFLAEIDSSNEVTGDTILKLRNLHKKLSKCYLKNAEIVAAIKKELNRRISSIVAAPKKEEQPKKAKADREKRVKDLKEQKKLTADQEKALKAAQAALKESKAILDEIIKKNK